MKKDDKPRDYRELVRRSLWSYGPLTQPGKLVAELTDAIEELLDPASRRIVATTEQAIRKEIDDGPLLALFAWADLLEEHGQDGIAQHLRQLARHGKRPGRVGPFYRWSPEKSQFGGGASWTLPEEVTQRIIYMTSDRKGRFESESAAMYAAALAMFRLETELKPEEIKKPEPRVARGDVEDDLELFSN